ncbi:hypothetical protein GQ53DRAFT_649004 [Thozetella sp. PMI_491]|nr:hypothetical protein GQ53DRAFT_649004 [Thozetella sp. PMI_491]
MLKYRDALHELKLNTHFELEALSAERAGNETLGFHKIWVINFKKRWDRADAIALQSYMSGIDIDDFPAVGPDMISDSGMPPTSLPAVLTVAELGCYRAHANIWAKVIREKLPPVLILESDAAWDINIRHIMSNMNRYFHDFLQQTNSTAVASGKFRPNITHSETLEEGLNKSPLIRYNPDDPWLSDHWDVLSIGQCFETPNGAPDMTYPDPYVPPYKRYNDYLAGNERVIRTSGGFTCLTAYAVSQTGAAKLLLRGAIDLSIPVDLMIRQMIMDGDLVSYSVMPTIMAQWEYAPDIGMQARGAQSDIRGGEVQALAKDASMPGWDKIRKTKSVWVTKWHHPDVAFQNMGLQVVWEKVLGKAALYQMKQ